MSEKLIPLALSSQIDNNGLEHIHAAPLDTSNRTSRMIWLGISGDLGDGYQYATEIGTYNSAGGVLPHTFTITAGTFPAGLTLASDGSWSGTRTTTGIYNWTVTVTDSDDNEESLDDTSQTFLGITLLTGAYRYTGPLAAPQATTSGAVQFTSTYLATSDDGLVIAGKITADNEPHIYRWDVDTATYIAAPITGSKPTYVTEEQWCAVSPDGEWVLFHHNTTGTLYAYQYDGSDGYDLVTQQALGATNSRGICFSPSGTQFAVCFEGSQPRSYSLNTNTGAVSQLAIGSGGVGSHRFLDWRSGYIVGSANNSGARIRVWNASTMVLVAEADSVLYQGSGSAFFSSDASYVYACGSDGATKAIVFAFDADAGTLTTANSYPLTGSLNHGCMNQERTHFLLAGVTGDNYYAANGDTLIALEPLPNTATTTGGSNFTNLVQ